MAPLRILLGIPESFALVFLVYALLGAKPGLFRLLSIGLVLFGLTYLVRVMDAPFPAHVLFDLFIMSVIISLWERIPLRNVVFAWMASLLVLIAFETIFLVLFMSMGRFSLDELWSQPWPWTLSGLPHVVLIACIGWWLYRRGGIRPFKETSGSHF